MKRKKKCKAKDHQDHAWAYDVDDNPVGWECEKCKRIRWEIPYEKAEGDKMEGKDR